MKAVIVSDIFGRTPELEDTALELSPHYSDVIVIDPYNSENMGFDDENAAYACFRQRIGMERYKAMLLESIRQHGGDLRLIGFSIGASAIWATSEKLTSDGSINAICFYGSQIRNFIDLDPKIELDLIFPEHEPHFDVGQLAALLCEKKRVTCFHTPFLHGFMNKKSVNFDENGYMEYMQVLKKGGRI